VKRRTIFLTAVFFACTSIYAVTGTGGAPGAFLRTGVGARALSLSGAFSANTDDLTCAYWNPAGSSYLNRAGVSTMYSWLSDDRKYNYISFSVPSDYGVFGAGFLNFVTGGIEGRESDTESFYSIDYFDSAYYLSWGREMIHGINGGSFSAGSNVKLIYSGLDKYTASGFSFDLGVIVKPIRDISVGVMFRDISGSQRWSTGYTEKFPFVMSISALVSFLDSALNLCAEGEKNEFEGLNLKSGLEASIFKVFFIRGGVTYSAQSYEFNYSLGAGIKYAVAGVIAQVDYAFLREQFFTIFEPQHKLSVGVFF
jgi:hypothetical protein